KTARGRWVPPARKPGAAILRVSFACRAAGLCARPPRAQRPRGGRGQYSRSANARGAHPKARGSGSQDHRPARGRDAEIVARDLDRGFRRRARPRWRIGQKDKNNGVLLIVAPSERKVRIEVGYGLEATLTDAVSKLIIENAIVPRFRANDVAGGVARGVD